MKDLDFAIEVERIINMRVTMYPEKTKRGSNYRNKNAYYSQLENDERKQHAHLHQPRN